MSETPPSVVLHLGDVVIDDMDAAVEGRPNGIRIIAARALTPIRLARRPRSPR